MSNDPNIKNNPNTQTKFVYKSYYYPFDNNPYFESVYFGNHDTIYSPKTYHIDNLDETFKGMFQISESYL